MKNYRPWERQTDDEKNSPRHKLDSISPSITSDLKQWLPTPEFEYKVKLFKDPTNLRSDKENMPPLEPTPMPVLNIEEGDFLERTEKLLEKDNKWETHVAQWVPLPRSSSPYPDNNQPGSLEQPEPKMEDDLDVRDFSERPMNDSRPPKPAHKPKVMLQTLFPPPPGCPDYIAMNATVAGILKPQSMEIRGILPEKKKLPRGWPTCLKRSPLKATFHDNIYAVHEDESEDHYEELKENESQEEEEPREKNKRVFYKLNVKDNIVLTNTPHAEEYTDENYESVEEQETAM